MTFPVFPEPVEVDENGNPIPAPTPVLTSGVDSYVTLEAADAILAARLFNEPWTCATPQRRAIALQTATAMLDRQKWAGSRTNDAQALAWPRKRVRDAEFRAVNPVVIPAQVATACAELALHLLTEGQLSDNVQTQMRMLGDSMVMHFASVRDELPVHVRRLLEPFLITRSSYVAELIV